MRRYCDTAEERLKPRQDSPNASLVDFLLGLGKKQKRQLRFCDVFRSHAQLLTRWLDVGLISFPAPSMIDSPLEVTIYKTVDPEQPVRFPNKLLRISYSASTGGIEEYPLSKTTMFSQDAGHAPFCLKRTFICNAMFYIVKTICSSIWLFM